MVDFLLHHVGAKPTITLKELVELMRTTLEEKEHATEQAIFKCLDGLFSLSKKRASGEQQGHKAEQVRRKNMLCG